MTKPERFGALGGSFKDQIENYGDAKGEYQGVGLKIASLKAAQGTAGEVGDPANEADTETLDNPAVKEVGDLCDQIVKGDDRGSVQFIKIEFVPHGLR